VVELVAIDEDKSNVENRLPSINGFVNFPIALDEVVPQAPREIEQPADFITHSYGVFDALASYLTELANFDEVHP